MEILKSLDSSPIVLDYKIIDFKIWETGFYNRVEIRLQNGTMLFTREYNDETQRNYSFHWQDSKGLLIMRWDNAPHHNHLKTSPHHLHKDDLIKESTDISIKEVLKYIEKLLPDL
ncbi:MAG: DUF6516 family protein [Deltaproteobacteria bacterium]|jgi:hypothetical protein|nr:DUF6516 family protein [Deltaproteobacteria bacterium]